MKSPIIEVLSKLNVEVNISHFRLVDDKAGVSLRRHSRSLKGPEGKIRTHGGKTVVKLISGNKIVVGEALCSNEDNFCYKKGREIALNRAIEKLS